MGGVILSKIVAFGHRKRVGKDLSSQFLTELLSKNNITYKKISFADKLYDIAHQLYGWDGFMDKAFYENHPEYKELLLVNINKTPRQILIDLGTTGIRKAVYNNTWVDYALRTKYEEDVIIISDLRFPNEFDTVKSLGGICIKINRPDIPNTDDLADCALENETRWDYVINNVGNFTFLYDAVKNCVKGYLCL